MHRPPRNFRHRADHQHPQIAARRNDMVNRWLMKLVMC